MNTRAKMGEQDAGSAGRFDLKKGLDYASTIIGLLAPAALFYAAGYVINQAYLFNVGLNATFWFNEFFYREAGAKFLLEIIAALMLLPHLLIPLAAALFLFFPAPGLNGWRDQLFNGPPQHHSPLRLSDRCANLVKRFASSRRRFFWSIVLMAAAGSLLLVRLAAVDPYAPEPLDLAVTLKNSAYFLFADFYVLPRAISASYADAKPSLYAAALLFALTVPLIITFCGLSYCGFRGELAATPGARASGRRLPHRAHGFLWLAAAVITAGYLSVAYGALFYDFVAVKVVDGRKCLPLKDEQAKAVTDRTILGCFLVGRYDKWYILLGWEQRTGELQATPPIFVKQVDALEPFSILTGPGLSVRGLLRAIPPGPPPQNSDAAGAAAIVHPEATK